MVPVLILLQKLVSVEATDYNRAIIFQAYIIWQFNMSLVSLSAAYIC